MQCNPEACPGDKIPDTGKQLANRYAGTSSGDSVPSAAENCDSAAAGVGVVAAAGVGVAVAAGAAAAAAAFFVFAAAPASS